MFQYVRVNKAQEQLAKNYNEYDEDLPVHGCDEDQRYLYGEQFHHE